MIQGIKQKDLDEKLKGKQVDKAMINQYFEVFDTIEDNGTEVDEKGKKKKKKNATNGSSGQVDFIEWVTYPCADSETYPKKLFPKLDLTSLPAYDKEGRIRYEIFCGGFLFYHDVIFKKYQVKDLYLKYYGENHNQHDVFEHKIYFEWVVDNNDRAKKVTIYITKTPPELNPTPKDPPGGPPPY